jgi:DNA-binding transcriptional LysR family regulator
MRMPQVSLVALQVVREVGRRGSFSAAAERLGYTQSAVSRHVALAEEASGRRLFVRHARGAEPTEAGRILIRHADAVVDELRLAQATLDDLDKRPAGRVSVGAFPTALAALVPAAVAAVSAAQPKLRISLREGTSPALATGLAKGRLDLAVMTAHRELPREVEIEALVDDPLLLLVSRDHRLATETAISADALRSERWVAAGTDISSTLLGAWSHAAWQPDIAFVARDWTAKIGLVAAGLGVTLVPGLAIPALPATVALVRIDDPAASRPTAVARRTDAGDQSSVDAFAEALRDAAAEHVAALRRRLRS